MMREVHVCAFVCVVKRVWWAERLDFGQTSELSWRESEGDASVVIIFRFCRQEYAILKGEMGQTATGGAAFTEVKVNDE
jgi:hypothetical protein